MSEQGSGGIDPGVIELAARVFDLARGGATEELTAYVPMGATTGPISVENSVGQPYGQCAFCDVQKKS